VYYDIVVVTELFTNVKILIPKGLNSMIFILPDVKNRVPVKNNDKISVT